MLYIHNDCRKWEQFVNKILTIHRKKTHTHSSHTNRKYRMSHYDAIALVYYECNMLLLLHFFSLNMEIEIILKPLHKL